MTKRRGYPVILNVDDNEAGRYVVTRQLKKAGYDTIEAATGEEALRLAEEHRPDLILLDVRLPDIDGLEVCRRIRGNPLIAGTPVLQISASYADISSRIRGLENGADGYVTEPAEPEFLTATIKSLLRMKRAELLVRQAARRWDATFNAIQDGIALLDPEGKIVQANKAWTELSPGVISSGMEDLFERLRSSTTRVTAEETVDQRTLSITMDQVQDERAEFSGAVCIVTDITRKKQFELKLRQTQKLESLGVLAGGIAHDFNNLLSGILGNSSLIADLVPESDPVHEMAMQIVRASESAASLTHQIVAYSGQGKLISRPVNLSKVVLESRALVARFIPGAVKLVCDTARNLPLIEADPGQMQQVVMNLVINAGEAFTERRSGLITVRTAVEQLEENFFFPEETASGAGEYICLTVSDDGCGMDEATQSRIFDPFFTTKFAGRGLGLSAIHGILSSHKGFLRLTSAPGRGTTFRIYFPSMLVKTSPPDAAQEAALAAGFGTILVIDDEVVVRQFVSAALKNYGYSVLLAEDGQSGLEIFRAMHGEIRLVLLDFTMPGLDGEQTLECLHGIAPDFPVILSSGFSESVALERFGGKGLAGFLEKPYTSMQLARAIDKVFRERRESVTEPRA